MKILIINGSHRPGNTDLAIQLLKPKLGKNSIRELILRELDMQLPDGCDICCDGGICPNLHDEFATKVEPTIRNYDLYIVATPTWNDGVTPLTKIFWDRIVSWSSEDRLYLRGKKLAVMTHGIAGSPSWNLVIDWVKSICVWEKCNFVGALTFLSGSQTGSLELNDDKINYLLASPLTVSVDNFPGSLKKLSLKLRVPLGQN